MRKLLRNFEVERTETQSTWTLRARVQRDDLDNVWVAECLTLPGVISDGSTREEALGNLSDAIGEAIAVRIAAGLPHDDKTPSGRRQDELVDLVV